MVRALLRRWRETTDARRVARHAIPDALWAATLAAHPFLQGFDADDEVELRRRASLFLATKEFTGAGGLVVDDAMAVAIAAQAVLPVLKLDLALYDGFVGIVVHPDEVVAPREVVDEHGIVHAYDEVLAGEAMHGGPVMLSWRDVAAAGESSTWGYNVVLHEFAHVIDMAEGAADGVPPLPADIASDDWRGALEAAYETHCRAVARGEEPALDPYGAQAIEEFFAVSAECFFVDPHGLRDEQPAWYAMLARLFRQNPAQRMPAPSTTD